ncbi:MAG: YceD family protein [Gammaproteobacteria bacterium]|nr:YceD family protein [Gammaproteobacteria bacterium]
MQPILPEQLDFVQAARKASKINGYWPVSRLERLARLVLDDQANIEAELEFDMQGRLRTVSGLVKASLSVTCQRCMQPMTLDLESHFKLALVSDESKAGLLPEEYEPLMLDEDNRVNIPAMLEDELLLAVPLVALHETDCSDYLQQQRERQASEDEQALKKDNPFSVLKDLL